jgi:hypothetical protein
VLNRAAENWYTYRSLVTQRLEVVAQTLHERNYDALIDNHEVGPGSWALDARCGPVPVRLHRAPFIAA